MSGLKLAQALNISLDDYIAKKGIVTNFRQKSIDLSGECHFKRPLRSEIEDDDDNDDDLIIEDRQGNRMETEDPPVSIIREVNNDDIEEIKHEKKTSHFSIQLNPERECRTFTTEEKKRGIKQIPSQQWRLRRENQVAKKPSGVPPLMSVKTVFDRNTEQLIASLSDNTKFQTDEAKNRITKELYCNKRQRNNKRYFNRNRFNGFQNRNNPNKQSNFGPNVSGAYMKKNEIKDLRPFISQSSVMQPQVTAGSGLWRPNTLIDQPRQLVTFADMLNQIGQTVDSRNRDMFTNVIRNVMQTQIQQTPSALVPALSMENFNRMDTNELMPFAAQTMLNHITTVQQNFGPKYDMKIQKAIHTLQGKPMFYGSNGVVISSDGTGVDNERIKPVATDLSMNMRFS